MAIPNEGQTLEALDCETDQGVRETQTTTDTGEPIMSIEAMKQAKSLIEIDCKQSWKRVEVLEMLSQAIATAVTESYKESSETQEPVAVKGAA